MPKVRFYYIFEIESNIIKTVTDHMETKKLAKQKFFS